MTGAIQLQFTLCDPTNPSAAPEQILEKLWALLGNGELSAEDEARLARAESSDIEDDDVVSELEEDATPEQKAKKKRRLRLARLKRKAKERGYEFTGGHDVAGVLFVEIQRITDLPPEKNGKERMMCSGMKLINSSYADIIRHGSIRGHLFGSEHLPHACRSSQSEPNIR